MADLHASTESINKDAFQAQPGWLRDSGVQCHSAEGLEENGA